MEMISKTIQFTNVELYLSIGIHEHERLKPQRFLISIDIDVIDEDEKENIDQTLDYDQVYQFLKSLENVGHFELQETVCRKILEFICGLPGVLKADVQSGKPDIFSDVDLVGLKMSAVNR